MPGLIRVGHKGADHVAPGNTLESFAAALEHGVDMIEFDVLRTRDGRLVLAHDYEDAEKRECVTLEEGLEHFAGEAYAGVELDVDLKLPGYEREVAEGLARNGLGALAGVEMYTESLEPLASWRPACAAGGRSRMCGATTCASPLYVRLPVFAIAPSCARRMPGQAAARIRSGGCEAIMAHRILVSPRLVRAVHAAGGQLYVWTVDDAPKIRALEALGVDGVITNDPRLFD